MPQKEHSLGFVIPLQFDLKDMRECLAESLKKKEAMDSAESESRDRADMASIRRQRKFAATQLLSEVSMSLLPLLDELHCFVGDMKMDTQRRLNIIRCQFKMIIDTIADEVQDGDELNDKKMQKRIDQYVQKNITGNKDFWSRKISEINSDFKKLYDKLRDSFSALC